MTAGLRDAERRRNAIVRAERQYEREAFSYWASVVTRRAEQTGLTPPTSAELTILKRLALLDGPFTASGSVRSGLDGIRCVTEATKLLERFVSRGWLHRVSANRLGQARYSFARDAELGRLPIEDRAMWDSWESMHSNVPYNRFTIAFNPLVAAGFVEGGDTEPDESGERPELECGICEVPDPAAEGDIWEVARKLALEEGTPLHIIAARIEGLTPIQKAYAMALAHDRLMSADPVQTHTRGIADYLGLDYNAFRAAVSAAIVAIQNLNGTIKSNARRQSRNSNADD